MPICSPRTLPIRNALTWPLPRWPNISPAVICGWRGERITGIVEKPSPDARPSDLVNIVAHIHPDAALLCTAIRQQYAEDPAGDDHYERAMAALMPAQHFAALRYEGPWRALKYPWHVLELMEAYLADFGGGSDDQRVDPSARVALTAQLSGAGGD